jgi:hypothetical protein
MVWTHCTLTSAQPSSLIQSRKLNTSPSTIEDASILKKPLTAPPVKKIDLHFPLGLEVTARNLKGVTIKDALDAIHKQFKKKVGAFRHTYFGQLRLM